MRVALDSSVLIAAHISRAGVCAELLEDVLLHHEQVTSEFILGELCRKLIEKFDFPKRDADQVASFLRRVGVVVLPTELPPDLCRDPTDVPVLGTGRCRRVCAAGQRRPRSSRHEDCARNSNHSSGRLLAEDDREGLNCG